MEDFRRFMKQNRGKVKVRKNLESVKHGIICDHSVVRQRELSILNMKCSFLNLSTEHFPEKKEKVMLLTLQHKH